MTYGLKLPSRFPHALKASFAGFKSLSLTFCLVLALLARTSKVFADEDQVDYRKQFYREDEGRMSIDTDSAYFDIGFGDHVRANGNFVIDAISGATPTGAAPQAQYQSQFPSFTSFYNTAFNQFFQPVINDPNNLILLQAGLFGPPDTPAAFQAYTNYLAINNPQVGTQATNSAAASRSALTNSPSFRNNSRVPLTQLHDLRRAGTLNFPITFGINTFTPGVSLSSEHDYHSFGLSFNDALQLNNKNTTLNVGWSHDADRVLDQNPIPSQWKGKVSDDILVGVNQLLTPKSYFTVDFTYGQEYGYLNDPYRGVSALVNYNPGDVDDPQTIPENRPRRRTKEVFYVSYDQFIDPLNGSAEASYRFYHDSYGIFAHTAELAWHQKLGRHFVLSPSIRYYNQTAAFFYAEIFQDGNNLPQFYSSDYRLSELETITGSLDLDWRIQKHFSLDLGYSRYIMIGLDNLTSQSAYPAANIFSVGGRVWF
jgi:Protein of unknown function (DUF3570)